MPAAALIYLLSILAAVAVLLLLVSVARKLIRLRARKQNLKYGNTVREKVECVISLPPGEFAAALEEYRREAEKRPNYLSALDGYLLGVLEQPGTDNMERYIAIARKMDFLASSLTQIRSRDPVVIALGSRRAGLYKFKEAVGDMIAALDFFSSENQFEILMGLVRIGNAEAVKQAFEKIKNSVLINERSAIEILSAFPAGEEKLKLFREMISCDTGYIASLFLKAADCEMASALLDDIKAALNNGNKEVRAAAVRSLATMKNDAPADILIEAMKDKNWEIRALAAKALGPIGKSESSMALFVALSDQQWWVRQNAAMSLIKHPDYERLFILIAESGDEYSRDSIIYALENSGSPILLRSIKILAG